MNFEITTRKKCEMFINIFNNLKNFTDKLTITICNEKFYIQGMDNNHVCVYELYLPSDWFDIWEVEESKCYGISLLIFNKILHICSDKQTIKIHSESEDNLMIDFISKEKGDFNKYFDMPLMDIDIDNLVIPDTEYEVDINIESKKLKILIDELSNFNETININCNEEKLLLESKSNEGTMKTVINIEDIDELAVIEGREIEISFGIKYIAQMCQFYKLATNCELHISEGIPLQLKYEIENDAYIRFFLAPKMEED